MLEMLIRSFNVFLKLYTESDVVSLASKAL